MWLFNSTYSRLASLCVLIATIYRGCAASSRPLNGAKVSLRHLVERDVDKNLADENFYSAVSSGDLDAAQALLPSISNVNFLPEGNSHTALHYLASIAPSNGVLRMMEYLLRNGANLEAKTDTGSTPLAFAVKQHGGAVTAGYLIEKWKANVNTRDNSGRSPLFYVLTRKLECGSYPKEFIGAVQLLLTHQASVFMHSLDRLQDTRKLLRALNLALTGRDLPLARKNQLSQSLVDAVQREVHDLKDPASQNAEQSGPRKKEYLQQLLQACQVWDQELVASLRNLMNFGEVEALKALLSSEEYPKNSSWMLEHALGFFSWGNDRQWSTDQDKITLALKYGGTTSAAILNNSGAPGVGRTIFTHYFWDPKASLESLSRIYEEDPALRDILQKESSLLTEEAIAHFLRFSTFLPPSGFAQEAEAIFRLDSTRQFYIGRFELMADLAADLNARTNDTTLLKALLKTPYLSHNVAEELFSVLVRLGADPRLPNESGLTLFQELEDEGLEELFDQLISQRRTKSALM